MAPRVVTPPRGLRWALVAAACAAALGCTAPSATVNPDILSREQIMRVDDSASGSGLTLRMGETLEVVLGETRTTGYRWLLVSNGAPVCRVESEASEPPSSPKPGAPGRHVFAFTGVERGAGVVELVYARPFGGGEPARRFSVAVAVE